MAVTIEQVFPLGRFHATRWRQNPFEDRYGEWPPSPWRLLRALLARWFQYARETGDDDKEKRNGLLRSLAGEMPAFRLPESTWRGQELRQYQPTAIKFTKKKEIPEVKKSQPTLVIDPFRALCNQQRVLWIWERLSLPTEERILLGNLLRRIHYFGRAESFTVLQLSERRDEPNCFLHPDGSTTSVPVLAHSPDETLDIDFLLCVTDDKRIASRPLPPGTAWYQAELPSPPRQRPAQRRIKARPKAQVVRFALDSTVLPLVTETLPIAEHVRRKLMGTYGRMTERDGIKGKSAMFSGKDADGTPLSGHRHAYYLPTDEDGDGRLDHLTVVAEDGFDQQELRALDRLHALNRGEEFPRIHLLMLGWGSLENFTAPPIDMSDCWVSATPFIVPRHPKKNGRRRDPKELLEDRHLFIQTVLTEELERLSARRDIGNPESVTVKPVFDEGTEVFRIDPTQWAENATGAAAGRFNTSDSAENAVMTAADDQPAHFEFNLTSQFAVPYVSESTVTSVWACSYPNSL